MRPQTTGVIMTVTSVLIWGTSALEAEGQVEIGTPERAAAARVRLTEVATAYQKLDAYADHGALELSFVKGGTTRAVRAGVALGFVRSERMVWDATVTGMAADGKRVTIVNENTTQPFNPFVATSFLNPLEIQPNTKLKWSARAPDPEQVELLETAGPTLLEILATLMTQPNAPKLIEQQSRWIRTWPNTNTHFANGRHWWIVQIQPYAQAPSIALWIDPGTNRVLWMGMNLRRDSGEASDLGNAILSWDSGIIATDVDKIRPELELTMARLFAQTVDQRPGIEVQPPQVPPAPVPPGTEPRAVITPPGGATQAPSKAAPEAPGVRPAALDAPGDRLPIVAVSLLLPQPSGQARAHKTPRSSLFRIIYCRLYPDECKPAVVPMP